MSPKIVFLIVFGYLLRGIAFSDAKVYRNEIKIPPVTIYESIFEYIQKKNYKDIELSIPWLAPVIYSIEEQYDVDIETELTDALEQKNDLMLLIVIRKLIFYDICYIFSNINKSNETDWYGQSKILFKIAYRNYLFLSNAVVNDKKKKEEDIIIKKLYRRGYTCFEKKSPYSKTKEPESRVLLAKYIAEIEKVILEIFPEFDIKNQGL